MAIDQYLYATGDDALENEFQIAIAPFVGMIDPVGINLRAIKVNTPEVTFDSYEVHYKTEKAHKPSGKQATDKTLTITFRLDKQYLVYKSLQNWINVIHNTLTGGMSPDILLGQAIFRTPITILTLDANGIPTSTGFIFKGAYIDKLPSLPFQYESGNPLVVDVGFKYMSQTPIF